MCALTDCTMSVYEELAWIWFTRTETCCQLCISDYMCIYIIGSHIAYKLFWFWNSIWKSIGRCIFWNICKDSCQYISKFILKFYASLYILRVKLKLLSIGRIMCALTECTMSVYEELIWKWFTRTETCCQLCISDYVCVYIYICCVWRNKLLYHIV